MKQIKARDLTDLAKAIQQLAYSYPTPYAAPTLALMNTNEGYTLTVTE